MYPYYYLVNVGLCRLGPTYVTVLNENPHYNTNHCQKVLGT